MGEPAADVLSAEQSPSARGDGRRLRGLAGREQLAGDGVELNLLGGAQLVHQVLVGAILQVRDALGEREASPGQRDESAPRVVRVGRRVTCPLPTGCPPAWSSRRRDVQRASDTDQGAGECSDCVCRGSVGVEPRGPRATIAAGGPQRPCRLTDVIGRHVTRSFAIQSTLKYLSWSVKTVERSRQRHQ